MATAQAAAAAGWESDGKFLLTKPFVLHILNTDMVKCDDWGEYLRGMAPESSGRRLKATAVRSERSAPGSRFPEEDPS